MCVTHATAATNAAEVLDAALTRPGRFDSKVVVGLPDRKGRQEIIDLYLNKVTASKGACLVLCCAADS
jgi:cell division protease FtsH